MSFEIKSVALALLTFSIPIAAAIIDKKAKSRRKAPQINAEPIDFEALERSKKEAEESTGALRRETASPAVKAAPSAGTAAAKVQTMPGRSAQQARSRQEPSSGTSPAAEEIRKDRKKLILYSEILKPKYDDFG